MQQNWTRWALIAVVIVGIVVVAKYAGGKLADLAKVANPKVSLYAWLVTGLMAVTFIVAAKVTFNRFRVPGVTEVVNAV